MRLPWITRLLALAWLVPQLGRSLPATAAELPEPIFTRQTVFAIPFQIERPDRPEQQPVEIQLFVSRDRGGRWELAAKAQPGQGQFLFRADADGEYWFDIRTLDRSGQLRPSRVDAPGLRVVVDTVLPTWHLQGQRGSAGEVIARWTAEDQHLKPESLTLHYRTSRDAPWQPVAVDHRNLRRSGATLSGEATWWPQDGAEGIQVRAEVSDAAGNLAVTHAQVPGHALAQPGPPAAPGDASSPWRAAESEASAARWPAEPSADSQFAATARSAADDPGIGDGLPPDRPADCLAADVYPPIHNQFVSPGQEPTWADGTPLRGERPRMVNSQAFELEYEAFSVGPSGVSRVELWGTRDGGRTWRSFAVDDDNHSPLPVTVGEEGLYGFRLVVTNGAGLGGQPPQSGDLPDVVIGVDLTKPQAQILAAEQGTGPESGALVISWQATDERLAAGPITLLFRGGPDQPWTTIATGLENTGRYVWTLDDRLPPAIYLRIEVRDEAGNVGACEASEPIGLRGPRPAVRIRDVRPLEQASRRTPKRYYFR